MRFRQDLRSYDNTALYHAAKDCEQVLCVFVLDDFFFKKKTREDKRLGFLYQSLETLEQEITDLGSVLSIRSGNPAEEIISLLTEHAIQAVYSNISYGKGREKRDHSVREHAVTTGIERKQYTDYLLLAPAEVVQRKVYTPFFKKRIPQVQAKRSQRSPLVVEEMKSPESIQLSSLLDHQKTFPSTSHKLRPVSGIRKVLAKISLNDYAVSRNIPSDIEGTTKLSPYLKFGILSPREVYNHFATSISAGHEIIIKELGRREFRQHIMYYFPFCATHEFQAKRRTIGRENNIERFEARKEGRTGYPIVDAAMRQLKQENRMHNRPRMIVASFLTKDLLIDRRRGEQHFADYLIDYDRNINIGNRQRSASVGPDPKPLRIFNPILQSKRFDPLAKYILKYIPELKGQPLAAIHDPIKYKLDYHPPIVDHYVWSKEAKVRYNRSKADYEKNLSG